MLKNEKQKNKLCLQMRNASKLSGMLCCNVLVRESSGMPRLLEKEEPFEHRIPMPQLTGEDLMQAIRFANDSAPEHMELLTANNNRITSAKGLETMALLKGVILYSNQITDISNLPTETLLYVDAADNQITDISHLKDLVANEQALILNSNQIRDISALKKGTRYRKLVLYDNPITSIDVLLESEGKMNGYSDCFYVSYFEGLSINPPYKAGYDDQIYFVDVPSDKQGAILKEAVEIKSFGLEPQFISKETADQNIDESREKISNAGSSLFFW